MMNRIRPQLRPALGRLAFALLSAVVLIVYSDKLYWYVTGYCALDLLLGYVFPAFVLLWVIDTFPVCQQRSSASWPSGC